MLIPPVVASLLVETHEFDKGLTEAKARMAETEAAGGKSFSGLKGVATGALVAVAAGTLALGAASLEMGAKYQEGTAKVAAAAGISVDAANKIGQAFLSQAFSTTFSAQETQAAYAGVAGQLGTLNGAALSSTQALSVMRQAQDLAEASGTSLDSATADLAKTMQAFGIPVAQASTATNDLYNVSVATGQSVDTVAQSMSRARAAMGAAAPPLSDMSGLMLDLTAHGETGRGAISALSSAFTGIISPSAAVTKAQKEMGVSFIDAKTHALEPLSQIFAELQPKLAGMSAAQADATLKSLGFGMASAKLAETIQAGPGVLQKYIAQVNAAGSAHEAAEKASNTLEGQEKRLGAGFGDLVTTLGTMLVPVVATVIGVFDTAAQFFEKNRVAAMALGAGIGAVVAVLVGLKVAQLASAVAHGIAAAATGVATAAQWAFNAAMNANPIMLVVLAVAALAAGFVYLYTHVAIVREIINTVAAVLKTVFATAIDVAKTVVTDFATFLSAAWTVISTAVSVVWNVIATVIGTAVTVISTTIGGIVTAVQAVVSFLHPVVGVIGGIFGAISAGVHFYISAIITVVQSIIGIVKGVVSTVSTVIGGITDAFKAVFNGLASIISAVAAPVSAAINGVIGVAKGIVDGVIDAINFVIGIIDAIQVHIHFGPVNMDWNGLQIPKIPTLDTGGIVSSPTLAFLAMNSKPEAVVPLSQMGSMGGGSGGGGDVTINANIVNPSFHGTPQEMLAQMQRLIRQNNEEIIIAWRSARVVV